MDAGMSLSRCSAKISMGTSFLKRPQRRPGGAGAHSVLFREQIMPRSRPRLTRRSPGWRSFSQVNRPGIAK